MLFISAQDLKQNLDYPSLIDAIDQMFRDGCTVPVRHHHMIETPDGLDPTLLLMPAWAQGDVIGVKVVTVFPENGKMDLPAVMGAYLLMDGQSGSPLAMLDGAQLTARRTACVSALASRYLSRPNASTLLMVGTGVLAPHLIRAHASVRPISHVMVWGRNFDKANALAESLAGQEYSVRAVADLPQAVPLADVISCATLARQALIKGDWMVPGQHLDLVGSFTPDMREADDQCIKQAHVYCDTREGAMKEAGDLVQPLANGTLRPEDVIGDLFDMARAGCALRQSGQDITFFKSAGSALADLATAKLAFARIKR